MARATDPLFRYPAIHTSDIAEFEERLFCVYGATGVRVPDAAGLDARSNFVRLHDIDVGWGVCGTSATIEFGESELFRLQLPLCGKGATTSGRQSTIVDCHRPSVTSAGRITVMEYDGDFEHLFLRIRPDLLERKLAALLGTPIQGLHFELANFTSPAMLSGLIGLVKLLVQQLDDEKSLLAAAALKELEQAALVQLLFAGRHNFSRLLEREPSDADSVPVRRVEAFIEANLARPIAIEELVDVAGVSARTLFRMFEKMRGHTPMVLVKTMRLERARSLLSKPDGADSVTAVAFACGFSNLGHFARDYRRMFGELPSRTLNRSNGRLG